MTECNAIIEANNEIDELKRENKKLNELCVRYGFEVGRLEEENEQLKQFQEQVASVIEGKMGDNVCNDYKMEVLKEIWNELELDEVWFE